MKEKTLSWGKCNIETSPVGSSSWKNVGTIKDGTTKLSTQAGEEHLAKEEGGAVIARRVGSSTYTLEFDLFLAAGDTRPFEDKDGIIEGEHQFRVIPESPKAVGFSIARASVSCEDNYTTAEGIVLHYVAKCLKTETGKTITPIENAGEGKTGH